jgi:hypothetical protein
VHRILIFASNLVPQTPSFDQEDAKDPEYTAPDSDCFNGNEGVMSLPTM